MIAGQLVAEIERDFLAIKATARDVQSEPRLMMRLANSMATINEALARARKRDDLAGAVLSLKLHIASLEKLWPDLEDHNFHTQAMALHKLVGKIKSLVAGVEAGRYA